MKYGLNLISEEIKKKSEKDFISCTDVFDERGYIHKDKLNKLFDKILNKIVNKIE